MVVYEAITPASNFGTQVNAEGANGWRFIGAVGFTSAVGAFESKDLYARDASTTYVYELLPNVNAAADLQAQLSAEGARGYRYGGPETRGAIYRKDNGSASTFGYRVLAVADNETTAQYIAQVNAQGAEGYYLPGASLVAGSGTVRAFQKDSQGSATYVAEALAEPSTEAGFIAQLQAQGARGFRFKTSYSFGAQGTFLLYDKDTSQSATFVYSTLETSADSAAFVTQANAQGQQGIALIGDYGLPGGAIKTLYVKPTACSGVLCDVRSPFGF